VTALFDALRIMSSMVLFFFLRINILLDNFIINGIFRLRDFNSQSGLRTTRLKINYFQTVFGFLPCFRQRNHAAHQLINRRSKAVNKLEHELDIVTFLRDHILIKTILKKSSSNLDRALAKRTRQFVLNPILHF
jgi:hypothetical protein